MNPIQGPWTLFKFPEWFYTFPLVFFCVLRHFFAAGLLKYGLLSGEISTNHTHTHQDDIQRQICRGTNVNNNLGPASTHPTLGPIRIRKRSAITGFGFSGLDRIVNIPTYARASWGSWEKRRKGRVRVSMKFLHHWKGHFIPGEKLEDLCRV